MKKGHLTVCVCALLLARAAQAQNATPPLDWRLRFQAGQEIRVRLETYSRGAFLMEGHKTSLKSSLALVYALQVLEAAPDGSATARLQILSFGYKGDNSRTFYGPFSSVESGDEEALRPLRLAARSSLNLKLGPRGEVDWAGENFEEHKDDRRFHAVNGRVLSAEEEEERSQKAQANRTLYSLAEGLRLLLAGLPQQPAAAGSKWSRSIGAHFTMPTHAHRFSSTLLQAGPQSATVGISEQIVAREQFSGTVQGSMASRIELDRATGWPRRAEIDTRSQQTFEGEPIRSYSKRRVVATFTLRSAPGAQQAVPGPGQPRHLPEP